MRILGIDYGEKRIGLAVSDETKTFARELAILSPKEFWESLNLLILNNSIGLIVIGWPLNMSGEMTEKTKEVELFKEKLEKLVEIKIEITDERLTSAMAGTLLRQGYGGLSTIKNKSKSTKKDLDSLAAQILLQNYLDKNKNI